MANALPRARTSFERALHFRTTPFAPVGDVLKAISEQDRRDFRYRHFAFAIRADFHGRHYGTCQLGAHDPSFAPTNVGPNKKVHPGSGGCQSERQEVEIGPVALRQRLDRQHPAPVTRKSRGKMNA